MPQNPTDQPPARLRPLIQADFPHAKHTIYWQANRISVWCSVLKFSLLPNVHLIRLFISGSLFGFIRYTSQVTFNFFSFRLFIYFLTLPLALWFWWSDAATINQTNRSSWSLAVVMFLFCLVPFALFYFFHFFSVICSSTKKIKTETLKKK